jgi:hypothetical protein
MGSPSLIDSVGHAGAHAPHEMHSSVIFIAMVVSPLVVYGFDAAGRIHTGSTTMHQAITSAHVGQMTNIMDSY